MKSVKKINQAMCVIEDFRKRYGINENEINVYEIKLENGKKIFSLKSGKEGNKEPFFVIDENNEIYTMSSFEGLNNFMQKLEKVKMDNFQLKLEKAIYQHLPVDFNDVWAVAIDKIKSEFEEENYLEIDFERLLNELKREYPNLFVDMQSMLERINENERL